MDSETLTYLLRGGHVNLPDRLARGLWPHRNERVFSSPQEAVRHYLKWELHLPGDLDGWKVIG